MATDKVLINTEIPEKAVNLQESPPQIPETQERTSNMDHHFQWIEEFQEDTTTFQFKRDDLKEEPWKTFLDGKWELVFMVEEGRNSSTKNGETQKGQL